MTAEVFTRRLDELMRSIRDEDLPWLLEQHRRERARVKGNYDRQREMTAALEAEALRRGITGRASRVAARAPEWWAPRPCPYCHADPFTSCRTVRSRGAKPAGTVTPVHSARLGGAA